MTVAAQSYPVTFKNTLPVALKLTPPGGTLFTKWKYVVIKNITPYAARLAGVNNTGGTTPTLPPGIANKFQYSGTRGAITITWLTAIATQFNSSAAYYILCDFTTTPTGTDLVGTYPVVSQPSSQPPGKVDVTILNGAAWLNPWTTHRTKVVLASASGSQLILPFTAPYHSIVGSINVAWSTTPSMMGYARINFFAGTTASDTTSILETEADYPNYPFIQSNFPAGGIDIGEVDLYMAWATAIAGTAVVINTCSRVKFPIA